MGFDRDRDRLARAVEIGAVGSTAADVAAAAAGADLAFVALPVGAIADAVVALLDAGVPLVTDVGSVKGSVVAEVARRCPDRAARFIGGHPMAGSEQEGIDGAPRRPLRRRGVGRHADGRDRRRARTRR